MDAVVLGDLLAREKRRSQPAVVFPAVDRKMSYRDFITTAYKSGNVLRYLGLGADATLAVDPALRPEPLLAFLGAAQLGATVTFDPEADARVRLVPVDNESTYEASDGRLAVFGGSPETWARGWRCGRPFRLLKRLVVDSWPRCWPEPLPSL